MNTPRARAHWIALIALLLCACGGGGSEDEPATTQPVDCTAKPELCR